MKQQGDPDIESVLRPQPAILKLVDYVRMAAFALAVGLIVAGGAWMSVTVTVTADRAACASEGGTLYVVNRKDICLTQDGRVIVEPGR